MPESTDVPVGQIEDPDVPVPADAIDSDEPDQPRHAAAVEDDDAGEVQAGSPSALLPPGAYFETD